MISDAADLVDAGNLRNVTTKDLIRQSLQNLAGSAE
jgi:hypothetical protein